MYDEILFPTDGSRGAETAFGHFLDIAAEHQARVHILNVVDTGRYSDRVQVADTLEKEGQKTVEEAADRARKQGVTAVTETVNGDPYRAIVDYAESRGVDLIVMPTQGLRGLERFLIGSTTERVIRRSDVPVLTVRTDDDTTTDYPYRNVLVPTDGSDCAREALRLGVGVAEAEDASLHLLSVADITSLVDDARLDIQVESLEATAREIVEEAVDFAEENGAESVSGTVGVGSSVHKEVLSYIEDHDVDLVVVGTHGRTGFDRYLLGSVTEYLVRTSPVPVLTVRKPAEKA